MSKKPSITQRVKMVQDILAVLGYRLTVAKVEGNGHKRSSPED